jgi:lysosomal acid lipase/cholesteryl ester hydrolase
MVREGYDVWLGNNRGTTFSRRHKTLDPDKSRLFWQFSF